MCGRYTLHHKPEAVTARFNVEVTPELIVPRFNIAPSQIVPIVREGDRRGLVRELVGCKWGLVPFWAEDPAIGSRMINARAETLAEKPSYKRALKSRRCLIPADGFCEWKKDGKVKQPMHIKRKDDDLFAFAGLWEEWKAPDGGRLQTCTIITTEPNELMVEIHNRMPVILPREAEHVWLDPAFDNLAQLTAMLQPYDARELEAYPVSTTVNTPAREGEELIAPLHL